VVQKHQVSERRACSLLGQHRSSHRHHRPHAERDHAIRRALQDFSRRNPRYGYRHAAESLRRDGHRINDKHVHRIWRQLGLQVPQRRRRWRHVGAASNGCHQRKAQHPNDVWAYDFLSDQTTDGQPMKILAIVDEFTREPLATVPARSIKAKDLIRTLRGLFEKRGVPKGIRSDNGPEFVAAALRKFLEGAGVATLFVEPGAPWQNGSETKCSTVSSSGHCWRPGSSSTSIATTTALSGCILPSATSPQASMLNESRLRPRHPHQPCRDCHREWTDG
jgi:putative transposase